MIAHQHTTDDALRLSRAVSGHGVQEVTLADGQEGVVLRVSSRLDSHRGDGWTEAPLSTDDLMALRDWIEHRLGMRELEIGRPADDGGDRSSMGPHR